MSKRMLSAVALTALLAATQGCTLKHQELLRDRDAEIRGLKAQLAEARARAGDLERGTAEASDEVRRLQALLADADARKPQDSSGLKALQDDLNGANVRMENGQLKIGIDNTITFASGSTTVKPSAHELLTKVARQLVNNFDGHRIYVEGHTDTDPINKTKDKYRDNRHLSMERADAVATYLIKSCGVPESRVAVIGFGPFDPVATGSSNDAKARNRRVEVVVGEPLASR